MDQAGAATGGRAGAAREAARASARGFALGVALASLAACAHDPVTRDPDPIDREHPAAMFSVPVESHGARLNGILYRPQGPGPHPVAVLLHGYPGDERNLDLAQAMRRAGWAVLFFHYRGAWGSEGDFAFGHAVEDAGSAVALARSDDFAREHRIDPARVALVGHSMGGFVALQAGAGLPSVDCVVSLSGANLGLLGRAARADPAQARAAAERLGRWSGPIRGTTPQRLVAEAAGNAEAFDTRTAAPALAGKSLLLVAGSRDEVTPPDAHHDPLVAALQSAGAENLQTEVLDADHAYSDRRIALARLVTTWLNESCSSSGPDGG